MAKYTLSNLTAEQKAVITDEQMSVITTLSNTAGVTDKVVSDYIANILKSAEKAVKAKARAEENDAKHLEKYLSYKLNNLEDASKTDRFDLAGMVVVTSEKFGKEVIIPRGHDDNAVVILRKAEKVKTMEQLLKGLATAGKKLLDELTDAEKATEIDYDVVLTTKRKHDSRTDQLVKNNCGFVVKIVKAAVLSRFSKIDDLATFLEGVVNSKGERKYQTLDLDDMIKAGKKGDKTATRNGDKYYHYFTCKNVIK